LKNNSLTKCPKCGKDSFNIFVFPDHYLKKCKSCLYPKYGDNPVSALFPLPKLKKKIIYLDQYSIIELTKIRQNIENKSQLNIIDPFWNKLFEKISYLINYQLIICPYSEFHIEESKHASDYSEIRRTFMRLSIGINFKSRIDIINFQIERNILRWLKQKANLTIDSSKVFNGNINGWVSNMPIHINSPETYQLDDDFYLGKKELYDKLNRIFECWKEEKRSIHTYFKEEWKSLGPTIINCFVNDNVSLINIKPNFCGKIVSNIINCLRKLNISESELWTTAVKYLNSQIIKELEFNKIQAALFACLARSAKGSQKSIGSKGMMTDIRFISYYLPYCDAVIVDKQCHHLIKMARDQELFKFNTSVYSRNNEKELLDYLDDIKKAAPLSHFNKVDEIYGISWRNI
jgi:hypothetical protein